jgi:hypothetical protein
MWCFPCQKHRVCTVYVWFWPTLHACVFVHVWVYAVYGSGVDSSSAFVCVCVCVCVCVWTCLLVYALFRLPVCSMLFAITPYTTSYVHFECVHTHTQIHTHTLTHTHTHTFADL